jgi:O-antigen/teichoic acid export membrane protein
VLQRPAYGAAFVVLTVAVGTNLFADSLFISLRESRFVLVRTIVVNTVRLAGPLLVAGFLSFAIFAVYTGGAAIALGIAVVALHRNLGLGLQPRVDRERLRSMWRFSAGNYVALTISGIPVFLLPVIVANGLGPAQAALWFIAALISGLLTSIPQATTQSFYAELAADPDVTREHLLKVLRLTVLYEVPGLVALLLVGWPILALFGGSYTDAYPVLALLSAAGAVASAGYVGRTLLLAAGRLRLLTAYSTVFCVLVFVSCGLVLSHGIVAVAVAWLVAEVLTSLLYVDVIRRTLRDGRLPVTDPPAERSSDPVLVPIGGTP